MLKFKIAKLEDVAEEFRSLYIEKDGAFFLNVEGAVAKEKLDEFRNTNVELLKQMEKYKDIDPEKYQELAEQHRLISEKKLIEEGKVEELIQARVQSMQKEHKTVIDKLNDQVQVSNRQLEVLIVDNAVREHAAKSGVAPSAVEDVLLRAKTVFKVEGGQPIAKDSKGEVIYGKDGQNSIGIGDWIGGLKEQAPHLFQLSSGSGAGNDNKGGRPGHNSDNMSPTQKIAAGLDAMSK